MTLATSAGEWGAFSSFVGATLVLVVLAFHRTVGYPGPRAVLMRLVFGMTLTLCLLNVLAWPVSKIASSGDVLSGQAMTCAAVVAGLLASAEPKIARWLDATTSQQVSERRVGPGGSE